MVAFGQLNFQAAFASLFTTEAALLYFVHDRRSFASCLPRHASLGSHTSLLVFRKGGGDWYKWSHPVRQPFGEQVVPQCPQCRVLNTIEKQRHGSESLKYSLDLKCRHEGCNYLRTYRIPDNATWFDNISHADKKGESGAWIVCKI